MKLLKDFFSRLFTAPPKNEAAPITHEFQQGMSANEAGYTIESNPYPSGSIDNQEWEAGWKQQEMFWRNSV